jgi:hypothetical protein
MSLLDTVFQALPLLSVDRNDLYTKPMYLPLFSALVALGIIMSDDAEIIDKLQWSFYYADKACDSFSDVMNGPPVAQAALVLSIHESCVRTSNASWVWNTIGAKLSLNCIHSRLRSKSDAKTLIFAAWMDLQNAMANGQSLSLPIHWSSHMNEEKSDSPLLESWKEILTIGRQILSAWNYNKDQLHQELMIFWERLPAEFKITPLLSLYVESNMTLHPPFPSSSILELNILFLAIFSLLHSNKSMEHAVFSINDQTLTSVDIVILTYRALNDILQQSLCQPFYAQMPYLSSYIHIIVNNMIDIPYLQTSLLFQDVPSEIVIPALEIHVLPALAKSNAYWPCAGILLHKLQTQSTELRQALISKMISSEVVDNGMDTDVQSEMEPDPILQSDKIITPKCMAWDFSAETLFEDCKIEDLISL